MTRQGGDSGESVREREEKYRLIFENANDAIFIAQDGVLKFPNPRCREMLGRSAEELAEVPFTELIHPDDRALVLERHRRRLQGERLLDTYDFRILRKSGEEIWGQINAVMITWEGRPATLNFIREVTEQKRLEEQLLQARKMESIGTLAGGIAHDFNNLLTGIMGNVSLMLSDTDPDHPHRERLEHIDEYAQSGADLTSQLLGFARGGQYEVRTTDLNELVRTSSEMFGRTNKQLRIHARYDDGLRSAEVDRGQIKQALLNLYVNAWQAMPRGGDLLLSTANVSLDEAAAEALGLAAGDYVKISVADTGVGMDEATRRRIFEPFFTTKEMGRGTGLGLASVYGTITNHGGAIAVDSQPGAGTTFDLYLPACDKPPLEPEAAAAENLAGATETVLLVDDEEVILDIGGRMLSRLGYQVLVAGSGAEALEIFRERRHDVDLVVLDMIMPAMSGGETYDRLKAFDPGVKVLLASGYSLNREAQGILARGCNGFLKKPFRMESFSQKIRAILDQ